MKWLTLFTSVNLTRFKVDSMYIIETNFDWEFDVISMCYATLALAMNDAKKIAEKQMQHDIEICDEYDKNSYEVKLTGDPHKHKENVNFKYDITAVNTQNGKREVIDYATICYFPVKEI